jgi:hypothetical protein
MACSSAWRAPTTTPTSSAWPPWTTARPLPGPALVAEENGAIVAALCLATGRTVADPFVPSSHLVELLRRHVALGQAPAPAPRGRRLLPHLALRAGSALIAAKRS